MSRINQLILISVLWNLETGYIKSVFKEANWEVRSKEDRSVEKIIFLNNCKRTHSIAPLVSCHSDGFFRLWNAMEGEMIVEFDCQTVVDEGLTTMAANTKYNQIIIGGCFGHVRIIDMDAVFKKVNEIGGEKAELPVINCWKAHLTGISSVDFVDQNDMVLTGSVDCAVRLWSLDGSHIGTFGDQVWNFSDPTLRVIPRDLQHEKEMDEILNRNEEKQRKLTSKKIIKNWQGMC